MVNKQRFKKSRVPNTRELTVNGVSVKFSGLSVRLRRDPGITQTALVQQGVKPAERLAPDYLVSTWHPRYKLKLQVVPFYG